MAKVKIPKRVAGVKIPKKVRRKVKKATKVVESPVVREIAAAALGAAAEAKAAKARARAAGVETRALGGATIRIDGDRLIETVRAAAIDGLRRFLEGLDEGLRDLEASKASGGDAPRANGRRGAAPDG